MPYRPINVYPQNTAIDINEGIKFDFYIDDYDTIDKFKIELYNLFNNKKTYTIIRTIGDIQEVGGVKTLVSGDKQIIQIFDENEEEILLTEYQVPNNKDRSTTLPIVGGLGDLSNHEFDLSPYLVEMEQVEKKKYYGDTPDYEDLVLTNESYFTINEEGIITAFDPGDAIVTDLVIPYRINGILVRGIADGTEEEEGEAVVVTGVFANNDDLRRVVIPGCIHSIGNYAFCNCENIGRTTSNLSFEPGVYFNTGNSSIGNYCFCECEGIKDLILLDTISVIGDGAFYGCKRCQNLRLPYSLKELKTETFSYCINLNTVVLPDNVTSIGNKCFHMATALKRIILNENLEYIGDESFTGAKVTELSIPSSVKQIGEKIIAHTTGTERDRLYPTPFLQKIKLPLLGKTLSQILFGCDRLSIRNPETLSLREVEVIGEEKLPSEAFANWGELTTITLNEGLKEIGSNAFSDCTGLITSVSFPLTIPSTVTKIEDSAFYMTEGGNNALYLRWGEGEKVELGNSVFKKCSLQDFGWSRISKIGESCFLEAVLDTLNLEGCSELIEIGYEAFGSSGLITLILPHSLKTVGSHILYDCPNLTNLTIPFIGKTNEINTMISTSGDDNYKLSYLTNNTTNTLNIQISLGTYIKDTDQYAVLPYNFYGSFTSGDTTTNIKVGTISLSDNINYLPANSFQLPISDLTSLEIPNNKDLYINEGVMGTTTHSFLTSLVWGTNALPSGIPTEGETARSDNLTNLYWVHTDTSTTWSGIEAVDSEGNKVDVTGITGVDVLATDGKVAYVTFSRNGVIIAYGTRAYTAMRENNRQKPEGSTCLDGFSPSQGKCGQNLSYSVSDNTLIITGLGDMYNYNNSDNIAPWITLPITLTTVKLPMGITSIGSYAFNGCSSLTTINNLNGNSLIKIGDYAFNGCRALKELYQTTATFWENLTYIGDCAFKNTKNLTTSSPASNITNFSLSRATYIGTEAFGGDSTYAKPFASINAPLAELHEKCFASIYGNVGTSHTDMTSISIKGSTNNLSHELGYYFQGALTVEGISWNYQSYGNGTFYQLPKIQEIHIKNSEQEVSRIDVLLPDIRIMIESTALYAHTLIEVDVEVSHLISIKTTTLKCQDFRADARISATIVNNLYLQSSAPRGLTRTPTYSSADNYFNKIYLLNLINLTKDINLGNLSSLLENGTQNNWSGIFLNNNITTIDSEGFKGVYLKPNEHKRLGFSDGGSTPTITYYFPSSITSIASDAFYDSCINTSNSGSLETDLSGINKISQMTFNGLISDYKQSNQPIFTFKIPDSVTIVTIYNNVSTQDTGAITIRGTSARNSSLKLTLPKVPYQPSSSTYYPNIYQLIVDCPSLSSSKISETSYYDGAGSESIQWILKELNGDFVRLCKSGTGAHVYGKIYNGVDYTGDYKNNYKRINLTLKGQSNYNSNAAYFYYQNRGETEQKTLAFDHITFENGGEGATGTQNNVKKYFGYNSSTINDWYNGTIYDFGSKVTFSDSVSLNTLDDEIEIIDPPSTNTEPLITVNQISDTITEIASNKVLYLFNSQEYAWKLFLYGKKYDVFITDNNTYADGYSYLPYIYAPTNSFMEVGQKITLQGDQSYLIDDIQSFSYTNKIFYRQSKGILDGTITYYCTANGMLKCSGSVYTIVNDPENKFLKSIPTTPTAFSTTSKYDSTLTKGYISRNAKTNKLTVTLEDGSKSEFTVEGGQQIALEDALITTATLSEDLINNLQEGVTFTCQLDDNVHTITAIKDYCNITISPPMLGDTTGYSDTTITLASDASELILPDNITSNQVVIAVKTESNILIEGLLGDNVKTGKLDLEILSLLKQGTDGTHFSIDGQGDYRVDKINYKTGVIVFSNAYNITDTTVLNHTFTILTNKVYDPQGNQTDDYSKKFVDIGDSSFDLTDLEINLNYINVFEVKAIERYAKVTTIDTELLYLVTCGSVVTPTDYEVAERTLEKEFTLERQSSILHVTTMAGQPANTTLVSAGTKYTITSNYIGTPEYAFVTHDRDQIECYYNDNYRTHYTYTNSTMCITQLEIYDFIEVGRTYFEKNGEKVTIKTKMVNSDSIYLTLDKTITDNEGYIQLKDCTSTTNSSYENYFVCNSSVLDLRFDYSGDVAYYDVELLIKDQSTPDYYIKQQTDNIYNGVIAYNYLSMEDQNRYQLNINITDHNNMKTTKTYIIDTIFNQDFTLSGAELFKACDQYAIGINLKNLVAHTENAVHNIFGATPTPWNYNKMELLIFRQPVEQNGANSYTPIGDRELTGSVVDLQYYPYIKEGYSGNKVSNYYFYDYSYDREATYEYFIVPKLSYDNGDTYIGYTYNLASDNAMGNISFRNKSIMLIGTRGHINSISEQYKLNNYYVADNTPEESIWRFYYNTDDKSINITTDKTTFESIGAYARVGQTNRSYKTGTFTALLGSTKPRDSSWTYEDSIRLQNKLQKFAGNGMVKLLVDEMYNVIPVDVTLKALSYTPLSTPSTITVNIEWVQIGDSENLHVYKSEYVEDGKIIELLNETDFNKYLVALENDNATILYDQVNAINRAQMINVYPYTSGTLQVSAPSGTNFEVKLQALSLNENVWHYISTIAADTNLIEDKINQLNKGIKQIDLVGYKYLRVEVTPTVSTGLKIDFKGLR